MIPPEKEEKQLGFVIITREKHLQAELASHILSFLQRFAMVP